jgi:hypothetical protein
MTMPAPEIPSTSVLEGISYAGHVPYDTMAVFVDEILSRSGRNSALPGPEMPPEPSRS